MDRRTEIALTFQRHYDYYRKIGDETRRQQVEAERSIKLQYSGRATFELLQNAFDRAEKHVVASVVEEQGVPACLIIGNDGQALTVDAAFDYERPVLDPDSHKRSDFHALCSLHTSNKTPEQSIGNKGVGFRSVFSLADRVSILSRVDSDAAWWGLEMHRCLTRPLAEERLRTEPWLLAGQRELLNGSPLPIIDDRPRPSFYFPLPLWCDERREHLLQGARRCVTLVIVPLVGPEAVAEARAAVGELLEAHYYFVGLRPEKRAVQVEIADAGQKQLRSTWLAPAPEDGPDLVSYWSSDDQGALAGLAQRAEHAISRPGVAVAWRAADLSRSAAKRYSYLPTLAESPFGSDVHADFQLGIDRTSIHIGRESAVGRYNQALLEAAAEAHLITVLRHLGLSDHEIQGWTKWQHITNPENCGIAGQVRPFREDLWRWLDPKEKHAEADVVHVNRLLFDEGKSWHDESRYTRWAELARTYFATGHSLQAFDDFWQCSAAWLDCNPERYRRHTKTWRQWADAMCRALRASGARVVPVIPPGEVPADHIVELWEPLPDKPGTGGGRAERRVFLRRGGDDDSDALHLPEALRQRGCTVTSFRFPEGIGDLEYRPTGVTPLDRWSLLQELRQLPNDPADWTPNPLDRDTETARQYQWEVLRFAAELFTARFSTREAPQQYTDWHDFLWRARKESDETGEERRRAGRAIATLFLPTKSRQWEPARQLCTSELDPEWMTSLADSMPGLELKRFLSFLGVSPQTDGLVLVEGGDSGIVSPQSVPPILVDAGRGRIRPLSIPWARRLSGRSRSAVDTLRECWDVWLKTAVAAEAEGRLDCELREPLGQTAWYPAGEDGAHPPLGFADQLSHIAPADLVLIKPSDRRSKVLWSLDNPRDGALLAALGAMPNLDPETLEAQSAQAARRILEQLTKLDLPTVETDPVTRQGLLELVQGVLDAVARAYPPDANPAPLLAFQPCDTEQPLTERGLRWVQPGQCAWIPADNSQRELLRRFFPRIPIVTATLGPAVVQRLPWLATRAIRVEISVRHEPLLHGADTLAERLRLEIAALLPGLLALAEVSRFLTTGINLQNSIDRWHQLRLVPAANTWQELRAAGAGLEPETADWLRDSVEDVLPDAQSDTLYFDVRPRDNGSVGLRPFGEGLAELLLDDRRVGATWGNALAEYDLGGPDRFDKFLAKQGAAGLAAAYRRALMPLSPEEEADFRERLSRALREHSWSLLNPGGSMRSLRHLTPEHLLPGPGGWGDATEADVKQCIQDVHWTDRQRPFQPIFTCREHHFRVWQAWLNTNDRRERLLNWVASLQVSDQNVQIAGVEKLRAAAIADRLDSPAEESLSRLAFNPEQNAWQWLSEAVPDLERRIDRDKQDCIDQLLPPRERYLPVSAIQSWGDWKPQPFRPVGPTEAVLAPINPDEVAVEAVVKLAVGADAEHALRHFVVEQTMALLRNHGDYAWKMLIEALPIRGRTRRDLESVRRNCTAEALANALHISRTWGSAGYDILGLEASVDGEPCVPVRYEVKGLPKRRSSIRVFLSPNELAVYRRVSLNGSGATADPRYRGRWRLVGVWPEGLAVDLTDSLKPLRDGQSGPLAELGKHGLSPQGLILTLTR